MLRITTNAAAGISVVALRTRTNKRGDYLITTTPPAIENAVAPTGELLFPQFADGGGYTTPFILFSGITGQTSSGNLRLVKQDGTSFNLMLNPQ